MKLLFLTSRFPYPLEKGDKLRAFHLIKTLSKHADIYLFAINNHEPHADWVNELKPYCKEIKTVVVNRKDSLLSMFRILNKRSMPFQVAYFWKEEAMQELLSFSLKFQPDAVFCHLIRMAEYAKQLNIHPSTLDYMDTFSMGMKRMVATADFYLKFPIRIEEKRLARYEYASFKYFDQHLIISKQDRDCIPHPSFRKIEVVANGVDFEYYQPQQLEKKYDLLFIGNMSYKPNIDSVIYAAEKILPALHKLNPSATLMIAGANPTAAVRDLANRYVTVSGWVENPRIILSESKIMVAPMLISIGLQNKILQAMAMKLPCVISKLANNAIGAPENECVLVADNPEDYAAKINMLLNDELLRTTIAENAYKFVANNFDWEKNTENIIPFFKKEIDKINSEVH